MLLFRCETFYQLISCIQIKNNYYPTEEAELILSNLTNFENYIESIKSLGLFNKIHYINDAELIHTFSSISEDDFVSYLNAPDSYFQGRYSELSANYSHIFFGVPRSINIIFYRYINDRQKKIPIISFFDEGVQTYLNFFDSFYTRIRNYKKCAKFDIDNLYIRNKDLFVGKLSPGCQLKVIPSLNEDAHSFNQLKHIFNKIPPIEEEFIFFEEAFDSSINNAVDVLEMVAEIAGKNRIAVKLHPRTKFDRFSIRGYKVIPNVDMPWEAWTLNSVSNKIFLTVSSTVPIADSLIFNGKSCVIFLSKMILGQTNATKNKNYTLFLNKFNNIYNSNEARMFIPYSENTLKAFLKYAEGVSENE